jgi:hypothetical protein
MGVFMKTEREKKDEEDRDKVAPGSQKIDNFHALNYNPNPRAIRDFQLSGASFREDLRNALAKRSLLGPELSN